MQWDNIGAWPRIDTGQTATGVADLSRSLGRKRRDGHQASSLCLWGDKGDGKSSTALHLAEIYSELHRLKTGQRRRIITNVLSFVCDNPDHWEDMAACDDVIHVESPFEWVMLNLRKAKGSILVVDELLEFLPGVRATSRHALQAEHYLRMTRKLKMDCLFTSINPFILTKAAFREIEYLASTSLEIQRDRGKLTANSFLRVWRTKYLKRNDEQDLDQVPSIERVVTGVEKIFGRYDTDEVLVGPFVPHAKEIRELLREERQGAAANEQLARMPTEEPPAPKETKEERRARNREEHRKRTEIKAQEAKAARAASAN